MYLIAVVRVTCCERMKREHTLIRWRDELLECQHLLVQSVQREAQVLLGVLLATLREKQHAVNLWPTQSPTRVWVD